MGYSEDYILSKMFPIPKIGMCDKCFVKLNFTEKSLYCAGGHSNPNPISGTSK